MIFIGNGDDKLRIMFELCDEDNEGRVNIEDFKVYYDTFFEKYVNNHFTHSKFKKKINLLYAWDFSKPNLKINF